MKIRDDLKEVLGGTTILLSKFTYNEERQYEDSPLRDAIPIRFGKSPPVKCCLCENPNIDWCWNCNKPHCGDHSRTIMFINIMNTLCLECAKELEKFANKEKKA